MAGHFDTDTDQTTKMEEGKTTSRLSSEIRSSPHQLFFRSGSPLRGLRLALHPFFPLFEPVRIFMA